MGSYPAVEEKIGRAVMKYGVPPSTQPMSIVPTGAHYVATPDQSPEIGRSALREELSAKRRKEMSAILTDRAKLWREFFDTLTESSTRAVNDNMEEMKLKFEHSTEVRQAVKRGKHRCSEVLNFPLKLILTPLKRGRRAANAFASMLEMRFGPLHVSLLVGDIVLEWDDSSLVSPYFSPDKDRVMQIDLQPHSQWVRNTEEHYSKMNVCAEQLNYPEQNELIRTIKDEKGKLIDALIDVIIRYNKHYYYNLFSRNCQHFVLDALEALEVEVPNELPGGLGEYYKALVEGKTPSVPAKFMTHSELDMYVMHKDKGVLTDMPCHDLEYLLTLYFRFHLERKTQLRKDHKVLEEWKCQEENCSMEIIEELINDNVKSTKLYNF